MPYPQIFDETLAYTYPDHLLEQVKSTPNAPGVYIFESEHSSVPLYIGKSVSLRTRLMSHLRNVDEVRLLRQSTRIRYFLTAGDIGAQLLEAQLIKTEQPLHNRKLRRTRRLYSISVHEGLPRIVDSGEIDFAIQNHLFGLFSNKRAAQDRLRHLADEHGLCLVRLKLETDVRHRPCFRHMIHRCAGVCCDKESESAHDARLLDALTSMQIQCWPYAGAIGIVENFNEEQQIHVVHHWLYLGSAGTLKDAKALAKRGIPQARFDADGYKILVRPLLTNEAAVMEL